MALADPQQELFTALRTALAGEFGGSVYDGVLPPDGTPYPFVYLGQCRMNDARASKDYVGASAYVDIHVWHDNPGRRGTVSKMLLRIKQACACVHSTGCCRWRYDGAEQSILADNTTTTPLMHGIITAAFHLQGGNIHA